MSKYAIIPGSIDMDDQSVGTAAPDYQNIKYLRYSSADDIPAIFEAAKTEARLAPSFEEAVSWQRELLEAGKPALMKFVSLR